MRFVIVQVVLAIGWWFLAVWVAVGIMGAGSGFSGVVLWLIFVLLFLASLVIHARYELRLTKR